MRSEIKVVLFLLASGLVAEGLTRWVEPQLSKDVAHLEGLKDLATRLEPQGRSNVLILGNSLARCGIDQGLLNEGWLLPSGQSAVVESLYPDASGIVEWGQGFRRYVLETGSRPEVVLVCTGRAHLTDSTDVPVERLAAWLVPKDERLAFVREEKWGVEEGMAFWLASWSRLFANRGRIQPLVFYHAVPGFEETTRQINHERGLAAAGLSKGDSPSRGATRHLERLIEDVAKTGARLVVVTMPVPEAYELPQEVRKVLEVNQTILVEGGEESRMGAERFPDGYHLDSEGARLFTTSLIGRLSANLLDGDRR